jgi:cytochrome c oxidase subunit 1
MENNSTYKSYLKEKHWNVPLFEWIFSTDHKRIGVMYLISMITFFLVGMSLAFLIKLEKLFPGAWIMNHIADIVGADGASRVYNSIFTLHGVIMVFLFIVPGLPSIFGNFFLPIMIGAKDVAFPKLNLASFWVFMIGAAMLFVSLLMGSAGPADTGWTFTVPYSTDTLATVGLPLFAAFVLGWGTILTSINFIVTIHRMRCPGMSWFRMPLFVWSLYATAWIQVLATPVIGITLVLLALERVLPIGFFDPSKGGDPILFQHLFWIYSHPAVYVMILPAMGAISEIIPVFTRRTIFGYKAIAVSTLAIAGIGYFVWAHHMFVTGMSDSGTFIFSFLTFFVGIPTAVKVFNWVASLYKGSIHLEPPMLFALSFIFNFTIGGLTGLLLGTLSADVHTHDTDFVVAHFHYTMFGGAATGLFGALHYWYPKMFGKMYNKKIATIAWGLFFVGFNTLYFPMFILGLMGQPRRYFDYLPHFQPWQVLSSIGAFIMVPGLILMFANLVMGLRRKEDPGPNPWNGRTLEWHVETTPSLFNFDDIPTVTEGPYEYPEGE